MLRHALGCAALALIAATPVGAADTKTPVRPVPLQCVPGINSITADALSAAIQARIAALPENRRSPEDLEAAIVYEISLHRLCPGVARTVLAGLGVGTGPLALAATRVASTLLPGGNVGTAGISNGSGGTGGSFFSAPIVGVGGGSSNYAQ